MRRNVQKMGRNSSQQQIQSQQYSTSSQQIMPHISPYAPPVNQRYNAADAAASNKNQKNGLAPVMTQSVATMSANGGQGETIGSQHGYHT